MFTAVSEGAEMREVVGPILLIVAAPYFVAPAWRSSIQQAALAVNSSGPFGRGCARAVTSNALIVAMLGLFGTLDLLWSHPGHIEKIVMTGLALLAALLFVVALTQVLFNKPRWMAPRELRQDDGAIRMLIGKMSLPKRQV